MKENNFIKQLTSSSYWTLNKDLCRGMGIQNALLVQHFIDLQYKVFDGKEFYQQQERIQEELGLTEWSIKTSVKYLLSEGFISVEKKGMPAKNHYTINEEKILSVIFNNSSNKSVEYQTTSGIPSNKSVEYQTTSGEEYNSIRKELIKKELKEKNICNGNPNHPLFSKTYLELIEKYGATDVDAERSLSTFNSLTENEKLGAIGGIGKYFLYLESKPGYSKKDLSYYLNDKVWEWKNISSIQPKPKTDEEIGNMITDGFEKWKKQNNIN